MAVEILVIAWLNEAEVVEVLFWENAFIICSIGLFKSVVFLCDYWKKIIQMDLDNEVFSDIL